MRRLVRTLHARPPARKILSGKKSMGIGNVSEYALCCTLQFARELISHCSRESSERNGWSFCGWTLDDWIITFELVGFHHRTVHGGLFIW